jgi:hypothetical protein
MHYSRARRYGDPLLTGGRRGPADPAERLALKTAVSDGCWLWTGRLRPDGYAQISVNGRYMLAHRLAWMLEKGAVPTGLELDHLCGMRHCVRIEHLEPVTHAENVHRGRAAEVAAARMLARTHCKHGHEFSPDNTYINCLGKRVCNACRRDVYARKVARQRALTP